MSDNRPIGIFDSGVGGLTVVYEIFKRLENESIIYFGDTARVPYGTKSKESVRHFSLQDASFLLSHNVKMIVAACHTASSLALDLLKEKFSVPVIGVVEPGIFAALETTTTQHIGVIGTNGTISSGAYEERLRENNKDAIIHSQACPLFVPLAEEGWLDGDITENIVNVYLEPFKNSRIDTLILGCTHYPLLKPVLRRVLDKNITLIDSAEQTAKVVARHLQESKLMADTNHHPEHRFYVSDIPIKFQEIGERFLGRKIENIQRVDIESISVEI